MLSSAAILPNKCPISIRTGGRIESESVSGMNQNTQTIIALRTFSVPLGEIADLFTKEQIVLRILKVDALGASSTWYLDQCDNKGHKERRLLLTGYNVGFPTDSKVIQPNLDFGVRKKELFSGKEMGEDVRRALDSYLHLLAKITARVDQERPVLNQALQWTKETLG